MTEPLPTLDTVAERVRYLRRRLGLTRRQLEAELRTLGSPRASVMTIRRTEAGARSPTADEILALARLADVPPAWILEGGAASGAPSGAAEEQRIVGHVEAELARASEAGVDDPCQVAYERVETRLRRLRSRGELSEAGWAFWLTLRTGAALCGGYTPKGAASDEG